MLFLNPWLLAALAGISIPVIIHLVRRQAAKPFDWGAMRFLMDTLSERRRRMEWEDLLLMAARCLLLALAALAVARPEREGLTVCSLGLLIHFAVFVEIARR